MKILGSDLDGTFTYMGIDDEKRSALTLWREKGNKFGIVSGRGHLFLLDFPKKNNVECDFLIAYNGGMICTPEGKVLHSVKCENVEAMAFIKELFNLGCGFVHFNNDAYYRIRKDAAELQEGEYLFDNAPECDFFYQISVELKTLEDTERIVKLINENYGDRLTPLQNGICIDIVPKGVNKAEGLKNLAAIYGASEMDVIAVGDNVNDADMIRAFRSYAMENGVQSIKDMATFTTKSVTELIYREI